MYKILIVEDDMTIANIIKEHLASWGMITRCVTDFQNVFSDFAEYSPHLVLLDISLPFYNGYHCAAKSGLYPRCRLFLFRRLRIT